MDFSHYSQSSKHNHYTSQASYVTLQPVQGFNGGIYLYTEKLFLSEMGDITSNEIIHGPLF